MAARAAVSDRRRFFVDPVVGPGLNAMRREWDCRRFARLSVGGTRGRRVLHVPRVVRWQPDWPTPLWQTDFSLWDERAKSAVGRGGQILADGDRPIVFTPGSAYLFGDRSSPPRPKPAELQRRGILLTRFAEQIPQSLPPG